MPKMSLLEMTQNILSAIDGDEVTSISDTVESLQVAEVVRETYYEICAGLVQPSRKGIVQLNASGDSARPNYMKIPDNVKSIDWVKYNTAATGTAAYTDVHYMEPEDFALRSTSLGTQTDILVVTDPGGARLNVVNNKDPQYWTTFDNDYLVFDSYNNELDTTLQEDKTFCWGQFDPVFDLDDAAIPELDADQFPLLLAEAKSVVFNNQKQTANPKEEQKARRQRVRGQKDQWRANQRNFFNRLPDYGRSRGRR